MVKKRRKRQLERRNKKEARKLILIGIIMTLIFIILAYLAFMSTQ